MIPDQWCGLGVRFSAHNGGATAEAAGGQKRYPDPPGRLSSSAPGPLPCRVTTRRRACGRKPGPSLHHWQIRQIRHQQRTAVDGEDAAGGVWIYKTSSSQGVGLRRCAADLRRPGGSELGAGRAVDVSIQVLRCRRYFGKWSFSGSVDTGHHDRMRGPSGESALSCAVLLRRAQVTIPCPSHARTDLCVRVKPQELAAWLTDCGAFHSPASPYH